MPDKPHDQTDTTDKTGLDKNGLPECILGYTIERKYGNRNIEDCIEDMIYLHLLHMNK